MKVLIVKYSTDVIAAIYLIPESVKGDDLWEEFRISHNKEFMTLKSQDYIDLLCVWLTNTKKFKLIDWEII